ncbi:MAG: translation initiation factor IF-2 N-terminal domain-containing protein, partial [Cyanophyceae cyanobacterium]
MSTGRVRIYDLSKELNLENRDILNICKEIGVEAKSHSSTITEDDATQIRVTASQKNGSSNGAAPPKAPPQQPKAPVQKSAKKPSKPPAQSPQIVVVRKDEDEAAAIAPKPTPPQTTANKRPERPSPPRTASKAEGGDRPAVEPKAPVSRPGQSNPQKTAAGVEASNGAKKPASKPASSQSSKPAATPQAPKPELSQKPTLKQKPQIVRKVVKADSASNGAQSSRPAATPARPSKPKPTIERVVPKSAADNGDKAASAKAADKPAEAAPKVMPPPPRPKLTRPPARGEEVAASTEESPRAGRVGPPRKKVDRPVKAGDRSRSGDEDQAPRKPKPTIVELRRPSPKSARAEDPKGSKEPQEASAQLLDKPTRPAAPSADGESSSSSSEDGSFAPRLRRPSPARPGKKTRDWTDGEREMRERNSSKERLKKRRSPIAIEEDDDDELSDEFSASGVLNTQVSLSIARPPKPKGMVSKPTSSAPAAKTPTKRRSRPSRNRRDRQNGAAQKQERPEIISLTDGVTVAELANLCIVPDTDIIKHLFLKGTMVNINQTLDIPTATMVAAAFGILVEEEEQESAAKKVTEMLDESDLDNLHARPPKPKGMVSKPTSSAPEAKTHTKRRSRPSRNSRDRQNGDAQKQVRPEIISLTDGVTVAEL